MKQEKVFTLLIAYFIIHKYHSKTQKNISLRLPPLRSPRQSRAVHGLADNVPAVPWSSSARLRSSKGETTALIAIKQNVRFGSIDKSIKQNHILFNSSSALQGEQGNNNTLQGYRKAKPPKYDMKVKART